MNLSRRALLFSAAILPAMANYADAAPVSLSYAAGRLSWPGGEARAVCGRGGVRADKREGDGASPEGTFPLLYGFYRADRIARPESGLTLTALQPNDGWVDDPTDPKYNPLAHPPPTTTGSSSCPMRRVTRQCGWPRRSMTLSS